MANSDALLYSSVEHLAAAVHSVVRIDAVRAKCGTVDRIFRELWRFETVRSSTEATAALRLFAFWYCHGR